MMSAFYKPSVSVIIPVYNGGENFRRCLASLADCTPPPKEVIVVADGDSDGSWRLAEKQGFQVLRIATPGGPAGARNLGARAAKGDILFFTDADVMIPADTIDRIAIVFQQEFDLAALFGSYDDEPFETNWLSQYRNLLHHYVHQTGNEDASTFWAGCGAIRREIFLEMGGFDKQMYRYPSIEDIELGYRLKKTGYKIRLVKELQVKHLKHWDILSLLRADFFYRALPWTNLLLKEKRFINDLNLKTSARLSVISVYMGVLTLIGAIGSLWLVIPALFCIGVLLILNWDLYRFFQRKRGVNFMMKVIPWHWLYFLYSGLAFALGYARHLMKKLRA